MHKGNVCVDINSPHLKLWDTYPKIDGKVMALEYVPKMKRTAYENQWRDWCRLNPKKSDWPEWVASWAETKARLERHGK